MFSDQQVPVLISTHPGVNSPSRQVRGELHTTLPQSGDSHLSGLVTSHANEELVIFVTLYVLCHKDSQKLRAGKKKKPLK